MAGPAPLHQPPSNNNHITRNTTLHVPKIIPQSHAADTDRTWLDYLRTAGGFINETIDSGHYLPADPQPLSPPHSPYRASYSTSGEVAEARITLPLRRIILDMSRPGVVSSSMNASDPSSRRSLYLTRRSSDIVLPSWQPDVQVDRCPVCDTDFSFWYRKHHCRKCGRVVCAACSPHRITIPRQYIVQPPRLEQEHGETDATVSRSLEGGEIVRVCNPCVPDPWRPPPSLGARPRQASHPAAGFPAAAVPSSTDPPENRAHHLSVPHIGPTQTQPNNHLTQPLPTRTDASRQRSHSQRLPSVRFSQSVPDPSFVQGPPREHTPRPGPAAPSTAYRAHRHAVSTNSFPRHVLNQPPATPSSHQRTSSLQPTFAVGVPTRRRIKEEDECTVCGGELPEGESARETHIEECISMRFSGAQSSTPPGNDTSDPSLEGSARARTMSFISRGMAVYRATEKDCISEDGETQECIICFEDFQPGDEMGRMECLCKFHRMCIRKWWETKGPGSCPTHQLQE